LIGCCGADGSSGERGRAGICSFEEPSRFSDRFFQRPWEEAMSRTREPAPERREEDQDREKRSGRYSDHGIVKDEKAEEQPKDKHRAQAVHKTDNG
jgi:hypothetical protein